MHIEDNAIRSCRSSGCFFVGLGILSAVLSGFALYSKEWWRGVTLLTLALFFGLVGWSAFTKTVSFSQGGGAGGEVRAGCPVPVNPSPPHHLAAARDLPPSEKTHSLPKD